MVEKYYLLTNIMYALKILNFVLFNAMFSILIIIMKIGIKRHVFFFQKGVFI